jgi:hypothetical protein
MADAGWRLNPASVSCNLCLFQLNSLHRELKVMLAVQREYDFFALNRDPFL